jgi:hypothetical protein
MPASQLSAAALGLLVSSGGVRGGGGEQRRGAGRRHIAGWWLPAASRCVMGGHHGVLLGMTGDTTCLRVFESVCVPICCGEMCCCVRRSRSCVAATVIEAASSRVAAAACESPRGMAQRWDRDMLQHLSRCSVKWGLRTKR